MQERKRSRSFVQDYAMQDGCMFSGVEENDR